MQLDEFLRWDDGTDARYELVRGKLRRREIAPATHGALLVRLGALIHDALKPRPDQVALIASALAIPGRDDTCYLADIMVAPTPAKWGDQLISDPLLVIEVVSPETYRHDLLVKRPDYMSIQSLREIVCIDTDAGFTEVFRRAGEQWFTEIVQGRAATLSLASVCIEISMAELYDGLPIPPTPLPD
jgi:Uma2 family endonuclease